MKVQHIKREQLTPSATKSISANEIHKCIAELQRHKQAGAGRVALDVYGVWGIMHGGRDGHDI